MNHLEQTIADIDRRIAELQTLKSGVLALNPATAPVPAAAPLDGAVNHRGRGRPKGKRGPYKKRGLASPGTAVPAAAAPGRMVIPGLDTEEETLSAKAKRFIRAATGPFDCNEVVSVIAPDAAEDPEITTVVRGALNYWKKCGYLREVQAGTPGHPARLERTASFPQ